MRYLALLPILVLAASTAGSPASSEKSLVVTRQFFRDISIKYTGTHDIVNLVLPLNRLNTENGNDDNVALFFVEADVNEKGEKHYQGLYMYRNNRTTKILDNGRHAAAFNDGSKKVFLGASDGIYVYDGQDGKVNKVSLITDSIVQVEADNRAGIIYYLTEGHELFSLNDDGVKTKIEALKNAQEFLIDYSSNIYYYDNKNDLYVFNHEVVRKIEGVPKPNAVKLVRPMYSQIESVFGVVDDTLYVFYSNATAEKTTLTFQVKPTAYSPEGTLLQYHAFEKKIYKFDILELLAEELFGLKEILEGKKNEIAKIAAKPRSAFGA